MNCNHIYNKLIFFIDNSLSKEESKIVSEHLDETREILNVEKMKFYATKKKAGKILEKIIKKGDISTDTLIELYDSNGISPNMVKEAAKKFNAKIKIPDDFYALVVERHEKVEQIHATEREMELDLEGIPETKSLYYYDYTETSNSAKVLKIIDKIKIASFVTVSNNIIQIIEKNNEVNRYNTGFLTAPTAVNGLYWFSRFFNSSLAVLISASI